MTATTIMTATTTTTASTTTTATATVTAAATAAAATAARTGEGTAGKYRTEQYRTVLYSGLPRWLSGLSHSAHRPEQPAGGAGVQSPVRR